jgi:pilus assembly protein CpaC
MDSATGFKQILPVMPPQATRDLESDEQRFSQEPRGPMAELLDSATANDAVLEVIVGQGRILTTKDPIAREGGTVLLAAGDPTVIEVSAESPRMVRVLGRRPGLTDLSITTDTGQTYTYQVHVVYDLRLLTAYLQQLFPDAQIEIKQLRDHIILQGQARSVDQIHQIEQTLRAYLSSEQSETRVTGSQRSGPEAIPGGAPVDQPPAPNGDPGYGPTPIENPQDPLRVRFEYPQAQIINLMRVPGVHQVMLKVQIAELNRTAFRQIGADIFVRDNGTILGSTIGGGVFTEGTGGSLGSFLGGPEVTAFGIFDGGDVKIFLSALRSNGILNILAEPNLMAMNGHEASFLAGGEIPVPIPQSGFSNAITIEYKEFGVELNFVPTILDDETIRLRVAPEVSNIDLATSALVGVGGDTFSALAFSTRRVNTTVELKQGQTLALAGLLQVDLAANTDRIPGLGDLPYLGPLFSNTTHARQEKELLVMVTPYLVSPMDSCQVPPTPGSEILDPNDCEFYFLNRIEGRTGVPFRSTDSWDDPCHCRYRMHLEHREFCGPVGYSE